MIDVKQLKKSQHVILGERDLALLHDLYLFVVMSYEQIAKNHFAACAHPTVFNRLKKLQVAGYILRQKVNRISTSPGLQSVGVVFQLLPKGLKVLAKSYPQMDIVDKVPSLQVHQLDHDLILGDVGSRLKAPENFAKAYGTVMGVWLDGRYLNAKYKIQKVPDAVIPMQSGQGFVAIELEMTAKSERRYREIISQLRTSQDLRRVVFITPSKSIGQKIKSIIVGYNVDHDFKLQDRFIEVLDLQNVLAGKFLI